MSDTFYPGWEATVDGVRVPILRANRAMRGVPTDAGRHDIEMRYRPRTFIVGAAISLPAWLLLLGGAAAHLRKQG